MTQGKDVDTEVLRSLVASRIEVQKNRLKAERESLASRQKIVEESLASLRAMNPNASHNNSMGS